ncbi:MAG TPA: FAD-binding oxidoreductase [Candidatus Paceibacterota bacterium]
MKEEIKNFFKGDVADDEATLSTYSHDASLFEVRPKIVLFPKDSEDVQNLVKWVNMQINADGKLINAESKLSITARSAGTDMTGGPLNESIILDFTRHMNKLLKFDFNSKIISVQPGMFYRDFEKITIEKNLFLPSYPASKSICAIGGMVGNNSGGEKTLKYGKTEDYVIELKIVLSDGNEYTIKALPENELIGKINQNDIEGRIYKDISELINSNRELINKAKPQVSKNSAGYYIWNVLGSLGSDLKGSQGPTFSRQEIFDLNKLIVGSQGTLGIVTEVTFRLEPAIKDTRLIVIFLDKIEMIAEVVNKLLKYKPESLEAYDDKTLRLAIRFFPSFLKGKNPWRALKFAWSFWPDLLQLIRFGFPKLVMLAEFEQDKLPNLHDLGVELPSGVKYRVTKSASDTEKYFEIRHESFNLLRQHVKGKRTAPFIDDIIVRPEFLPKFLPELNNILKDYPIEYTLAGHPGDGNFHIIPLMDMKDPRSRKIIPELSNKVYDLVLRYHGSITAEHNDGIIRTPYLEKMFGKEMIGIFNKIKNIFDPQGVFNPGKKTKGDINYIKKHLMW